MRVTGIDNMVAGENLGEVMVCYAKSEVNCSLLWLE